MDERTYTERELRERVDQRRESLRSSMAGRIRDDALGSLNVQFQQRLIPGGVVLTVDEDSLRSELLDLANGVLGELFNAVLDAMFSDD